METTKDHVQHEYVLVRPGTGYYDVLMDGFQIMLKGTGSYPIQGNIPMKIQGDQTKFYFCALAQKMGGSYFYIGVSHKI